MNEIQEKYTLIQKICSGSFADAWKAKYNFINEQIGIKIINKKSAKQPSSNQNNSPKISDSDQDEESQIKQKFLYEVKMMKSVKSHPFIIQLYNYAETPHHYYVIMEYCPHKNLAEQLKQFREQIKMSQALTSNYIDFSNENEIKRIFVQIVRAVNYLHKECHIAHRDLKAENVVLDENMNAKIIDFGLSCPIIQSDDSRHILEDQSICGPPNYIPPEMILKNTPIGDEVDIWMLGVLLYFMIYNCFPYETQEMTNLMSSIAYLQYPVPPKRKVIKHVVQTNVLQNQQEENQEEESDDSDIPDFMKTDIFGGFSKKVDNNNNKKKKKNLILANDISLFGSYSYSFSSDSIPPVVIDRKVVKNAENSIVSEKIIALKEVQVDVSDSCQDLIRKMLCKDPSKRISLDQILQHEWITEVKNFESINTKPKNENPDFEEKVELENNKRSKFNAKFASKLLEMSDSELLSFKKNRPLKEIVESFFKEKNIEPIPFDIELTEKQMNENIFNDNTEILRFILRQEEMKQIEKMEDEFKNES